MMHFPALALSKRLDRAEGYFVIQDVETRRRLSLDRGRNGSRAPIRPALNLAPGTTRPSIPA